MKDMHKHAIPQHRKITDRSVTATLITPVHYAFVSVVLQEESLKCKGSS